MSETKIILAKVITTNSIIEDAEVCFCDGKITNVGERNKETDKLCTIIDAHGNYVSPGFIDIHTHGAGGHDFMDCTKEAILGAVQTHVEHGTTSIVPTTLAGDIGETVEFLKLFAQIKGTPKTANLLGVHLEGPYFSINQKGAQDEKYIKAPNNEEYEYILSQSDDIIRWSVAPELDGAIEFADRLLEKNILVSIGHSDAIFEQVQEAFIHGCTHITHLYSGMSTIIRKNGYRYSGVVESAYIIDDMTVEIIADGSHLPKELLQLVYKSKGADKIALVTDSMRGAGQPDGESILGSIQNGQKVIIEDNVAKLLDKSAFAGSVATADKLVKNMISLAGVPICDAVKMMSTTPAKILGIKNKGELRTGYDADIVIFDKDINVTATIVNGEFIYEKRGV